MCSSDLSNSLFSLQIFLISQTPNITILVPKHHPPRSPPFFLLNLANVDRLAPPHRVHSGRRRGRPLRTDSGPGDLARVAFQLRPDRPDSEPVDSRHQRSQWRRQGRRDKPPDGAPPEPPLRRDLHEPRQAARRDRREGLLLRDEGAVSEDGGAGRAAGARAGVRRVQGDSEEAGEGAHGERLRRGAEGRYPGRRDAAAGPGAEGGVRVLDGGERGEDGGEVGGQEDGEERGVAREDRHRERGG